MGWYVFFTYVFTFAQQLVEITAGVCIILACIKYLRK